MTPSVHFPPHHELAEQRHQLPLLDHPLTQNVLHLVPECVEPLLLLLELAHLSIQLAEYFEQCLYLPCLVCVHYGTLLDECFVRLNLRLYLLQAPVLRHEAAPDDLHIVVENLAPFVLLKLIVLRLWENVFQNLHLSLHASRARTLGSHSCSSQWTCS